MRACITLRSILTALFFAIAAAPSAAAAEQDAVALFAAQPGFRNASLSPDGNHLALVLPLDTGDRLGIIRIGAPGVRPVAVTFTAQTIHRLDWASNERVIVRVHTKVNAARGAQASGQFPNTYRAMSVAVDGANMVRLLSKDPVLEFTSNRTDNIVDLALDDPQHVYIQTFLFQPARRLGDGNDDRFEFNLYRANLLDGSGGVVARARTDTASWIMDGKGNLVARIDIPRGRGDRIFVPANGDFRQIATLNDSADNRGTIEGVSEDGRSLAVLARREANRMGLYRLDLATGAWGEALFFDPAVDVADVILDERTLRVAGVVYFDGGQKYRYFAPERQRLQSRLEEVLPGRTMSLLSSSSDAMKHLVLAASPRRPPVLFLVDLAANRVDPMAQAYPRLEQVALGDVRTVSYAAPDGIALTGLLTLPPAREARNLPLVVMPAGFTGFGVQAFDPLAHFLSQRGYAVFHAGTRELKSFSDVSAMDELGQWIAATSEDLSSGVNALVAGGIVDRARVCVMGRNSDGYVALEMAVFAPAAFACAISINGFADLELVVKSARLGLDLPSFVFDSKLIRNSGDHADQELERYSPVNHVQDARGAFLMIEGEDGAWRAQTERMAGLLRNAGKTAQYVEVPGENGSFERTASMARMLTEVDRFLAAHMAP